MPSDRARLHGFALEILEALPGLDLQVLSLELADHARAAREHCEDSQRQRWVKLEQSYAARAARHAELDWQLGLSRELWQRVAAHEIHDPALRDEFVVAEVRLAREVGEQRLVRELVDRAVAQGVGPETMDLLKLELARAIGASGEAAEAIGILRDLLDSGRLAPDKQRGAMLSLGMFLRGGGKLDEADAVLARCLSLARAAGDDTTTGFALLHLIDVLEDRGQGSRTPALEAEFQTVLARHRNVGLEVTAGVTLGVCRWRRGNLDSAEELLGRAWTVANESGQRLQAAIASVNLGVILLARSKYEQAIDTLRVAVAVAREIGSPRLEQGALVNIAVAFGEMRQLPQAEAVFREALVLARRVGEALIIARNLNNLAFALMAQDRNGDAVELLREAKGILFGMGVSNSIDGLRIGVNLAQALARTQQMDAAVVALAEAEACARTQGVDANHPNPFTRQHWEQIQSLRKELGT